MNDNLVSSFFLASLYLLLIYARAASSSGIIFFLISSGVFSGIALGAKLTMGPFILGLGLGVLFIKKVKYFQSIKNVLIWGAAVVSSFLVWNGFWMYKLWVIFKNPFFPYFNSIFKSPYWEKINLRHYDESWWSFVSLPFQLIKKGRHFIQYPVRDMRLAILLILLVFFLLFVAYHQIRKSKAIKHDRLLYALLLTCGISYGVCLFAFQRYRYLLSIELLAPILIFLLLLFLLQHKTLKYILVFQAFVIGISVGWVHVGNFGRVPFSESYFDVEPIIEDKSSATVFLMGPGPRSYLVPFFPPQYRFVRIESNIFDLNQVLNAGQSDEFFHTFIEPTLKSKNDRFFSLTPAGYDSAAYLSKLGFMVKESSCRSMTSNEKRKKYDYCEIEKTLLPSNGAWVR